MKKIILAIIFLLILANVCSGDLIIPHQPREDVQFGNTELGLNGFANVLDVDLKLRPVWKIEDDIFIMPKNYQGEAELYTLGFYVDYIGSKMYDNETGYNWFTRYYIL